MKPLSLVVVLAIFSKWLWRSPQLESLLQTKNGPLGYSDSEKISVNNGIRICHRG